LSNKKLTAEMAGEALREVGILVIVFAPLYELFEPQKQNWQVLIGVITVGVVFLTLGITVERVRS
jgi:hypothetical protein